MFLRIARNYQKMFQARVECVQTREPGPPFAPTEIENNIILHGEYKVKIRVSALMLIKVSANNQPTDTPLRGKQKLNMFPFNLKPTWGQEGSPNFYSHPKTPLIVDK